MEDRKQHLYIFFTLFLVTLLFTRCDEFKLSPVTKVETGEATSLATSITVEGEIIDLSGKGNDDHGFCYSTDHNDPSIDDDNISKGKPQTGKFTGNIEGLK